MSDYTSSIIFKYGDTDNVRKDVATLKDIINRQGAALLIDYIASYNGEIANKHELKDYERVALMNSLLDALKESLLERL